MCGMVVTGAMQLGRNVRRGCAHKNNAPLALVALLPHFGVVVSVLLGQALPFVH
jgi:hypothetical protein